MGVRSRDRISSSEVAERLGIESIEEGLRKQTLSWFGNVLRGGWNTKVNTVLMMEATGMQDKGQLLVKRWKDVVEKDTRVMWLEEGIGRREKDESISPYKRGKRPE